jgi:hypothetical protein
MESRFYFFADPNNGQKAKYVSIRADTPEDAKKLFLYSLKGLNYLYGWHATKITHCPLFSIFRPLPEQGTGQGTEQAADAEHSRTQERDHA